MILLQLNLAIRDNFAFVDIDAPIHLSLSSPRGSVNKLTHSILRGLRGNTILDVNGVVDITTGKLKAEEVKPDGLQSNTKEANQKDNGNKKEIVPEEKKITSANNKKKAEATK